MYLPFESRHVYLFYLFTYLFILHKENFKFSLLLFRDLNGLVHPCNDSRFSAKYKSFNIHS